MNLSEKVDEIIDITEAIRVHFDPIWKKVKNMFRTDLESAAVTGLESMFTDLMKKVDKNSKNDVEQKAMVFARHMEKANVLKPGYDFRKFRSGLEKEMKKEFKIKGA